MKNKKGVLLGVIFFIVLICSCSSVSPERESDFQINADWYEKGNFSSIGQMKNQKFLSAVKISDYDTVKDLLENRKVSSQTYDNFQQTALMWACWNKDYYMVKLLLDYQDEYRDSLSFLKTFFLFPWSYKPKIINTSHINATSRLSSDFLDTNYKYMALFCAAYQGDDKIMELLLDPDKDKSEKKRKALHRNASIESQYQDLNGENLLHKMAKSGKASNMREFLIDSEYNVNTSKYKHHWQEMYYQQNKNGYTPFHLAILNNDTQMVRLLLDLEKTLKRPNEEPIVNIYADLGEQRSYPLYTAYKVRNPSIFEQLLMCKDLNTDIKFPDGNAEHTYNGEGDQAIDEEFYLGKKRKAIFTSIKKDTSTFKTLDFDVNVFVDMFEKRDDWEKNGRKGELNVTSEEFNKNKDKLLELLEFGTETTEEGDTEYFSISGADKEIRKLKDNLYGDFNGNDNEKDLLELVAKSSYWKTPEKIVLIDLLLDGGYYSLSPDNDILYYCLKSASEENDLLKIAIHLIKSHRKYENSYSFYRPNREPYVQLMTKDYIRNSLNWDKKDGLEYLLDTINSEFPFASGWRNQNIICAVVEKTDENNVPHTKIEKIPNHALSLFKYFKDKGQYNESISIDSSPLCSWFFEIGFDDGIDEIFKDENLVKKLRINASFDTNNKRFINLLLESTTEDEHRKQKIAEWKSKYERIFPNDSAFRHIKMAKK